MADLIKKIKIKKQDGTFTDYIPIGAEAQNISTSDGDSVQLKLNKKPYYYNSVADMKADTKLKAGDMAVTLGYYSVNDGGNAEYTIVDGNYTDDGGSYHELDNHLFAKLITEDSVNVDMFGAYGDANNDSSARIQAALNYCSNNKKTLVFNKKVYQIANGLHMPSNNNGIYLLIDGNEATLKAKDSTSLEDYIIYAESGASMWVIQNLQINGNFTQSGIKIQEGQKWSLQNVKFHYCYRGLTLINTYYGNIDSNCMFDTCLFGMVFDEDLVKNLGEINTLKIDNCCFDCHQKTCEQWGLTGVPSVAIQINCLTNSVKFTGIVVESYDYAVKGINTQLRNGYTYLAYPTGSVSFSKCYFERIATAWLDWDKNENDSSKYIEECIYVDNCHFWPATELKANLGVGYFIFKKNKVFKLIIKENPRQLTIDSDMDLYYMDLSNYDYNCNFISHDVIKPIQSNEIDKNNPITPQTFVGTNRNRVIQNANFKMYNLYMDGSNMPIKNSMAMSINSKNISFWEDTINPTGLIINGTDNNKYMLTTDDGINIKMIKMSNKYRYLDRYDAKDAYWLYSQRTKLENGTKFFCIDIGKRVILQDQKWYAIENQSQNNYIAIGTTEDLLNNLASQPHVWWKPCWDLSFNRAVFLQSTSYSLAFDWAMNNNPQTDSQQVISVYGPIANRPTTSNYEGIYYATDEQKYYKYNSNLNNWEDFTPIATNN